MVSYWLYVAVDATLNTGKKTSKMVDLIFSDTLIYAHRESHFLRYYVNINDSRGCLFEKERRFRSA